jgi:sec-independent protein translocase protein TatA
MLSYPLLAWIMDPWTMGLVAIVALLLFGKRLPEVGRSLGKGIAEFKKGLRDVGEELNREDSAEPPRRLQSPTENQSDPARLPPETRPDAPRENSGSSESHGSETGERR